MKEFPFETMQGDDVYWEYKFLKKRELLVIIYNCKIEGNIQKKR